MNDYKFLINCCLVDGWIYREITSVMKREACCVRVLLENALQQYDHKNADSRMLCKGLDTRMLCEK